MEESEKIKKEFPTIIPDEEYQIVKMMDKYGGSFVKSLARAFYRADVNNFKILKEAFPEYWRGYKFIAEREAREKRKKD